MNEDKRKRFIYPLIKDDGYISDGLVYRFDGINNKLLSNGVSWTHDNKTQDKINETGNSNFILYDLSGNNIQFCNTIKRLNPENPNIQTITVKDDQVFFNQEGDGHVPEQSYAGFTHLTYVKDIEKGIYDGTSESRVGQTELEKVLCDSKDVETLKCYIESTIEICFQFWARDRYEQGGFATLIIPNQEFGHRAVFLSYQSNNVWYLHMHTNPGISPQNAPVAAINNDIFFDSSSSCYNTCTLTIVYKAGFPNIDSFAEVYLNGVQQSTAERSELQTGSLDTIIGSRLTGGEQANYKYGFNGSIFSIRAYNRQLTQTEILQNYANDQKRFPKSTLSS